MQRGQSKNKNDNAAACLCFLNYPTFLRPAADRAVPKRPWVASRGHSYRSLWADSIIQKHARKGDPTPACSPVSDRRRLTALVEAHRARRVQAPIPQISGPNSQKNQITESFKEEECAVSTQDTAALREKEMERAKRCRPHLQIFNQLHGDNKYMTSICKNCIPSTTRRGWCHSALSKTFDDEVLS
jgi:hypothetical protein